MKFRSMHLFKFKASLAHSACHILAIMQLLWYTLSINNLLLFGGVQVSYGGFLTFVFIFKEVVCKGLLQCCY